VKNVAKSNKSSIYEMNKKSYKIRVRCFSQCGLFQILAKLDLCVNVKVLIKVLSIYNVLIIIF